MHLDCCICKPIYSLIVHSFLTEVQRIGAKENGSISCPKENTLRILIDMYTSYLMVYPHMFLGVEVQQIIFSLFANHDIFFACYQQPFTNWIVLNAIGIGYLSLLSKFTESLSSLKLMNEQVFLRVKNQIYSILVKVYPRNCMFQVHSSECSDSPETIRVVDNDIMSTLLINAKNEESTFCVTRT